MQPLSVEQAKVNIRIEDVIRQRGVFLRATQGGERLEDHCLFHTWDATPSFHLYITSQRYHCFGCGADGDTKDIDDLAIHLNGYSLLQTSLEQALSTLSQGELE